VTQTRFLKTAGVITAFAAIVFAGMMSSSKRVRAPDAASAVAVSYAHTPDDIASVAPEHCKLLKEDAKVRVIHCILKKGDKVGMHSHPPFVVYFIKGGKSRYTLADGTTRDVETKNDEAQILPPVTHSGEQLDDVDEILVELKQ
jgi:quercetin dioxygenase-like cupin family protein